MGTIQAWRRQAAIVHMPAAGAVKHAAAAPTAVRLSLAIGRARVAAAAAAAAITCAVGCSCCCLPGIRWNTAAAAAGVGGFSSIPCRLLMSLTLLLLLCC